MGGEEAPCPCRQLAGHGSALSMSERYACPQALPIHPPILTCRLLPQVMSIRYMDGKVIGMSLFKGDVGLHCVDLTRMKPFSSGGGTQQRTSQQASRRASAGGCLCARRFANGSACFNGWCMHSCSAATHFSCLWLFPLSGRRMTAESSVADVGARGMRFSEKHPLPPQAPSSGAEPSTSASANWLPSTSAFVPAPPAAGVPQAGPAGVFVAEKRRQVLEARSGAVNAGPAVEVHAPSLRHARYTPFTPAVPGGMAPGTGAGDVSTPQAAGAMRTSQGSEGWGSRPPRVSAEENSGGLGPCSDSVKREQAASQHNGAAATCQWEQQHAAVPSTSMLEVASHRGFLAVALQGSREQCGRLQASRALFGSAKAALQRGDVLGAVRLLREGNGECGRWVGCGARVPPVLPQLPCPALATLTALLLAAHHLQNRPERGCQGH